jgi:hypothetical protein
MDRLVLHAEAGDAAEHCVAVPLPVTMECAAPECRRGSAWSVIPVTPGPIVLPHELLGDTLLEMNRPARALQVLEALRIQGSSWRPAGHAARVGATSAMRRPCTLCVTAGTIRAPLVHERPLAAHARTLRRDIRKTGS